MKKFVKVAGMFVALDLPDPREDGPAMIKEVLGALLVFAAAAAIVLVFGVLQ